MIDTILTLTNVGSAVYVAGQDNVTNKGTAVTAGLLVGALWFSSAIYGYSKTSECEDSLADDEPVRYGRPPIRLRAPPPGIGGPAGAPAERPATWDTPTVTLSPPPPAPAPAAPRPQQPVDNAPAAPARPAPAAPQQADPE